ncbi:O-antigen ligase family protein [Clostridium sp. PL3]|uniref:O-antigen ligase family protein n=1 Tax=Clostridium thailandense TaxID=2794346 RepID=A0A949TV23_9CLOT|nr:O-antigen ligase family protein [Clostridium thailandense]MBV7271528.1 O-antigen ligase family protein [Clostridium thailandense]
MDILIYLTILIFGSMVFLIIIGNQRWPLYLFFALYAVLPEYFAVEFSSSLPLLTASRIIILILCVYYFTKDHRKSTIKILKQERLYMYFAIYFIFRIIANGLYMFSIVDAVKELFIIIFEQLVVLLVVVSCLSSEKVFLKCLKIFIYSSAVIFVIGILQSITGINVAYYFKTVSRTMLETSVQRLGFTRAEATFGHPVYFGQFCALVSPLIMYMYESSKQKKYLLIFLLDIVALLFSNSRGSIISFVVLMAIMFIDKKKSSRRKYYGAIAFIGISIILVSLINPFIFDIFTSIFKSILNVFGFNYKLANYGENAQGLNSRAIQLSGILYLFKTNTFLFGLGANPHIRGIAYFMNPSGKWYATNTLDVGYLEYILSEGIVGSIGVLSLFIGLLVESIRSSNKKDAKNANNAFKYCFIMYFLLLFSAVGCEKVFWTIIVMFIAYNKVKMKPIKIKQIEEFNYDIQNKTETESNI